MECVNVKKNGDKYPLDKLAPINYSIDYAFAITMVANPLMWMEMQNLEKGDVPILKEIISTYKAIREDFEKAFIQPIGNRPNGTEFTGFNVLVENGGGYLILFKELNDQKSFDFDIDLTGKKVEVLYKSNKSISVKAKNKKVTLTSNKSNVVAIVKYQ